MLALYSHSRRAIALLRDKILGGPNMEVTKESYSSSMGMQVAAVNFAVKYRHGIFADEGVKARALESFRETERAHGERTGLKILELGVDRDHAHLLIQWGPAVSLAEVVRLLKGRCAKDVLGAFPELRARKFWGGHMWSPAYHFLTTGIADVKHHADYVANQGKPRLPVAGPGQTKLDGFGA